MHAAGAAELPRPLGTTGSTQGLTALAPAGPRRSRSSPSFALSPGCAVNSSVSFA